MAGLKRGWEQHEQDIAEMFGVSQTTTSGNKWYDPGDGVTRGRYHAFPLFVDGKYSEKGSFSVSLKTMKDYEERAAGLGKRLLLAVRLWPKQDLFPHDYVVLSAHDFKELLDLVEGRGNEPGQGTPSSEGPRSVGADA